MKEIQTNKKAYFDFEVIKSLEVGVVLESYEIKQIAESRCNLKGSFAKIINNECWLFDMYIQKYDNAVFYNKIDEKRQRKLLLHKKEIKKLNEELKCNPFTLVPLKIYINDSGKCKILLGLCRGKKLYDKKQSIKEKDLKRREGN